MNREYLLNDFDLLPAAGTPSTKEQPRERAKDHHTDKDFRDIRLSRPVSVTDLWDIDDRIDQLERISEKLERAVVALEELYREERIKSWELILQEMMKQSELKKGNENAGRFRQGTGSH
jgi:hypothetical protein